MFSWNHMYWFLLLDLRYNNLYYNSSIRIWSSVKISNKSYPILLVAIRKVLKVRMHSNKHRTKWPQFRQRHSCNVQKVSRKARVGTACVLMKIMGVSMDHNISYHVQISKTKIQWGSPPNRIKEHKEKNQCNNMIQRQRKSWNIWIIKSVNWS